MEPRRRKRRRLSDLEVKSRREGLPKGLYYNRSQDQFYVRMYLVSFPGRRKDLAVKETKRIRDLITNGALDRESSPSCDQSSNQTKGRSSEQKSSPPLIESKSGGSSPSLIEDGSLFKSSSPSMFKGGSVFELDQTERKQSPDITDMFGRDWDKPTSPTL